MWKNIHRLAFNKIFVNTANYVFKEVKWFKQSAKSAKCGRQFKRLISMQIIAEGAEVFTALAI